jgi:hypothetical protein
MGVTESERSGAHGDVGAPETDDEDQIVAAIDEDDSYKKFIVADISRDGAWVSMRNEEAPILEAWR